jgi:hypothetical protein
MMREDKHENCVLNLREPKTYPADGVGQSNDLLGDVVASSGLASNDHGTAHKLYVCLYRRKCVSLMVRLTIYVCVYV